MIEVDISSYFDGDYSRVYLGYELLDPLLA